MNTVIDKVCMSLTIVTVLVTNVIVTTGVFQNMSNIYYGAIFAKRSIIGV